MLPISVYVLTRIVGENISSIFSRTIHILTVISSFNLYQREYLFVYNMKEQKKGKRAKMWNTGGEFIYVPSSLSQYLHSHYSFILHFHVSFALYVN